MKSAWQIGPPSLLLGELRLGFVTQEGKEHYITTSRSLCWTLGFIRQRLGSCPVLGPTLGTGKTDLLRELGNTVSGGTPGFGGDLIQPLTVQMRG